MNQPALRIGNVAAGALALGGGLALALPQHVVSIAQLVILAVAASAGLRALASHVPATGLMYPLKWGSPFGDAGPAGRASAGGDEVARIRAALSRPRQRLSGAPDLPPEALRLLRPLLRSALELDRDAPVDPDRLPDSLSPAARAILTTEPLPHGSWVFLSRADERGVTETAHAVLDEVEHIAEEAAPGATGDRATGAIHSSTRNSISNST